MSIKNEVEIDCVSKFPMEQGKWERFEAQFIVKKGGKLKSKKVVRKTWVEAYSVARKWYNESINKGIKVRIGMGINFD